MTNRTTQFAPEWAVKELRRPRLRVLIADDHWIARTAICHLLPKLFAALDISEASSTDEAIALAESKGEFDLVILDLNMPGCDSWKAINVLKRYAPIVVMSVSEDRSDVLRCLQEGAFGYIPKTAQPEIILSTIERVLNGEVALPQKLLASSPATAAQTMVDDEDIRDISVAIETFTPRQKEIFIELSSGASNKDIARLMDLSVNTVRVHLQAITSKLKVKNRATLALYSSRWRERFAAA